MNYKMRMRVLFLTSIVLSSVSISALSETVPTPAPISGRNLSNSLEIVPADVLSRVNLLMGELDNIRKAMGKPAETQTIISVTDASPREVYFEAEALYDKANRLAYEVTGSNQQLYEMKQKNILPVDVWKLVNEAYKRVLIVKGELDIKGIVKEKVAPNNTTPTQVFNAILQANQELNSLLYKQVSPSDVFEEVTFSINVTEQLLKHFNIHDRIPDADELIPEKTPADVYKKLVRCTQILGEIGKLSNVEMLKVHVQETNVHQAKPSNVFDLTKIIVSEVKYLSSILPNTEKVGTYYPGYKIPSQVYQRVSILEKQLILLKKEAVKNPNWLKSKKVTGLSE